MAACVSTPKESSVFTESSVSVHTMLIKKGKSALFYACLLRFSCWSGAGHSWPKTLCRCQRSMVLAASRIWCRIAMWSRSLLQLLTVSICLSRSLSFSPPLFFLHNLLRKLLSGRHTVSSTLPCHFCFSLEFITVQAVPQCHCRGCKTTHTHTRAHTNHPPSSSNPPFPSPLSSKNWLPVFIVLCDSLWRCRNPGGRAKNKPRSPRSGKHALRLAPLQAHTHTCRIQMFGSVHVPGVCVRVWCVLCTACMPLLAKP